MRHSKRRWKIIEIESRSDLAMAMTRRHIDRACGFIHDDVIFLNDSSLKNEAVFALCRQHIYRGGEMFQHLQHFHTVDFTHSTFEECLEFVEQLYSGRYRWPTDFLGEITFDQLLG